MGEMSKELKHIDASQLPDLLRIAEEVRRTKEPRLIRRNGQDLAVVSPVSPTNRPTTRATSKDDPLWNIVGIGRSKGPTDTSANKHRYLADAYTHS
jgi:hypothetical protein